MTPTDQAKACTDVEPDEVCYACLATYEKAVALRADGKDQSDAIIIIELDNLEFDSDEPLTPNERTMIDLAFA